MTTFLIICTGIGIVLCPRFTLSMLLFYYSHPILGIIALWMAIETGYNKLTIR